MLKRDVADFDHQELLDLFDPINNHKKIGLAVSGGADSIALLVLVHRWLAQKMSGPRVIVYTMDHGLRDASASECQQVEKIATQFGYEARTLVWQGMKPSTGIQAAARHARYILMGQAMKEDGVEILLTGHHGEDQAETVLMRLAHSSGIGGLRGMDNITEIMGTSIFRPFLALPKARLAGVVSAADLEIANDPSNEDTKYERVRWRNLLEPLAEMGLNSLVLRNFATRMGRANAALDEIAQGAYESSVKNDQFGVGSISLKTFINLGAETGIRVLSRMIFAASGGRSKGGLGQLENIVEMIANQPFDGVSVAGCMVQKYNATIVVFREAYRIENDVIQLDPLEKIIWDQRFSVENTSESLLEIKLANMMSRETFEMIAMQKFMAPMAGLHAVPLIVDPHKNTLAIGAHSLAPGVTCALIEHNKEHFSAGIG